MILHRVGERCRGLSRTKFGATIITKMMFGHHCRGAGGSSSLDRHPRLDPMDRGDTDLQRLRRGVDAGPGVEELACTVLSMSVEGRSA